MIKNSDFQIQFELPLASVSATNALVVAEDLTRDALRLEDELTAPGPEEDKLAETVQAIEQKLGEIQVSIQSHEQALMAAAKEYALEIVRVVLQSDNEFLERRLLRFVELGLAHSEQNGEPEIFVHSECLEKIEAWMKTNSDHRLELFADDSISPGDCRIEVGETGLMTSINAHLDLIANRLKTAIENQGAER